VSHKAYVGVLAHDQPLQSRAATRVPADVAELLVKRLVAEAISRKVIRMLPPDSVCLRARDFLQHCSIERHTIDGKLPPREVNGTYFQQPRSNAWRLAHRMVVLPQRSLAASHVPLH
jgi:hypothetical protein